jgi:hypothetical protein
VILVFFVVNQSGSHRKARHSVRAAIGIQADKLSRLPLSHCFTLNTEHFLKKTPEISPLSPGTNPIFTPF